MKKLLLISPNFPPVNGADMHRVRQSIPYYKAFGWNPTVVSVKPERTEAVKDPLLLASVPKDIRVIAVNAWDTRWTRKLGLGSLAWRSMFYYWREVNRLLKQEHFDLIFFSTTQFPLLILGNYWKRKFGIPYVIDMQDPWINDYYEQHPWIKPPPKYWLASRLNRWLEPIAMRRVSAIIAVSSAYHETLCQRYPYLTAGQCHTLTFGAVEKDYQIARNSGISQKIINPDDGHINIVYAGIANFSMCQSLYLLIKAICLGRFRWPEVFHRVRVHFVGTTYAPGGRDASAVAPIAYELKAGDFITEHQERIPYFETIKLLTEADILLLIGTDDPTYSASKLYPYILARKPLLAILHEQSNIIPVIRQTGAGHCIAFGESSDENILAEQTALVLKDWIARLPFSPDTNWEAFAPHLALAKTMDQVRIFNQNIKT